MKLVTPIFPLIAFGLLGVLMIFDRSADAGFPGAILLILGALALAWLIATLFNIAIFAPIYCLLGRRQKAKTSPANAEDHRTGTNTLSKQ